MKRTALYSSSGKKRPAAIVEAVDPILPPQVETPDSRVVTRFKHFIHAHRTLALVLAGVLAVLSGVLLDRHLSESPPLITQRDIDRAVRVSLEEKPLPSKAAKAYEVILPSVVRVDGFDHPEGVGNLPESATPKDKKGKKEKGNEDSTDNQKDSTGKRQSVGTGVVITERGSILTNLHVVLGTSRIQVVFADGTESEAVVTGVDPDNDLAVLQAKKLPDDLQPATLITTGDLRPGDEVLAVGFPFGFGPSASTGVVSGLKREFLSSDGQRALANLIQFDAAANPGNSGGPLVNMEGEVLGIVTAILNPTQQRFFVGLAFAVPIENAASAVGVPPF